MGSGGPQQVGLAGTGRADQDDIMPALPFRQLFNCGTYRILTQKVDEALVLPGPERQRKLRAHTSGLGGSSGLAWTSPYMRLFR